jgi:hypothetical protein
MLSTMMSGRTMRDAAASRAGMASAWTKTTSEVAANGFFKRSASGT